MKRNRQVYFVIWLVLSLIVANQTVQSASAASVDPGAPGPYSVAREDYDFGATALTLTNFPAPVEFTGSVHYPTDLGEGPFPLIVFLHGRHVTCQSPLSLSWPCTGSSQPIPSYRGYDYIGQILASHGYIVVSISANGINARDNSVADLGMGARAELIQRHLDLWNTFNITGGAPFGSKFVGSVDLQNIGTMGHSRGGEGVVRHFLFNAAEGLPYGIKAVLPLAPTDFNRPIINNVPLAVMLPYCDGDVSDLQGVHFYDDARYNVPGDPASKHTVLVMGANHNFFNIIWTPSVFAPGSSDDWAVSSDPHCGNVPGNKRLTDAQQRGTGLAYVTAFFRTFIGRESSFLPLLTGELPPPPSAMTDDIFVSFHAPDDSRLRRDINRLLNASNLTSNTLGGAVTQNGLTPYDLCGGEAPQPQHCLPTQSQARQPHTTQSFLAPSKRGLSQLQIGWNASTAEYINALPIGTRDLSGYSTLQFRAAVNFADSRNPVETPQDLTVILTDGAGRSGAANVSDWSKALFYPPGQFGAVPKVILNTVRIPFFAFTASAPIGFDLADIRSVQFKFNQTTQGALLISDIAFTTLRQVVNDLVLGFIPDTDSSKTTSDTSGCPSGFIGKFSFTATLAAKQGSPPISNLVTSVNRLTNNNLLQNADDGPGGVGAQLTISKGLDPEYADGILTYPENIRNIPFTICLTSKTRFTFLVDVLGAIGQ
jgi:hypothetical protein